MPERPACSPLRRSATPALLALSCAAVLAAAAPGAASARAKPRGSTAPAYPGNTVGVTIPHGHLVAGTVQRVRLSGRARWKTPRTDELTNGYTLAVYVQDAALDRHCTPTYGGQRRKAINIPGLNATTSVSGFVVDEEMRIEPRPPANVVDWKGASLPFTVRPGIPRVLVCAYQRYLTDDVAFYERPVRVRPLRCRFRGGSVHRGRRPGLRCNFAGRVRVALSRSGQRRRIVHVKVHHSGRGRMPSGQLAPGRWTARFSAGGMSAGRDGIRIRR